MGGTNSWLLAKNLTEKNIPSVRERILTITQEYNDRSEKPYRIAFSFGLAAFNPDEYRDLEEMLQVADSRQYEEKRRRKGETPRG